jgi:peroxiredoxin
MKSLAGIRRVLPILAFGLLLLAAVVFIPSLIGQYQETQKPRPGFVPPDFSLRSVNGETISLSSMRGKPVVLVFVASWCEVCREEMPTMVETYKAHQVHDVVFLAVDSNEDRAPVAKFRDEFGIPFPLLLDADGSVAARYDVKGTPTNFFIDRGGRVRDMLVGGPLSRAYLDKEIAPLLQNAMNLRREFDGSPGIFAPSSSL